MNTVVIHKGNGELKNPKAVRKFFDAMPNGKHLVSSKEITGRTMQQNDYLHWVFSLVQEGLYNNGYREIKTREDAKFVCKDLFLFKWVDNGSGGKIKLHGKTSKLTKAEMSEFIEQITQWSAEYLGVVIPPPNSQLNAFV